MLLSTQLKRGYLALIGLFILGLGIFATPEPSAGQSLFSEKTLVAHTCKMKHQAHWKFVSTPFDMPSLPHHKTRRCRS